MQGGTGWSTTGGGRGKTVEKLCDVAQKGGNRTDGDERTFLSWRKGDIRRGNLSGVTWSGSISCLKKKIQKNSFPVTRLSILDDHGRSALYGSEREDEWAPNVNKNLAQKQN